MTVITYLTVIIFRIYYHFMTVALPKTSAMKEGFNF